MTTPSRVKSLGNFSIQTFHRPPQSIFGRFGNFSNPLRYSGTLDLIRWVYRENFNIDFLSQIVQDFSTYVESPKKFWANNHRDTQKVMKMRHLGNFIQQRGPYAGQRH